MTIIHADDPTAQRRRQHLRALRAEYGEKARAGLLLHGGPMLERLGPRVLAAR